MQVIKEEDKGKATVFSTNCVCKEVASPAFNEARLLGKQHRKGKADLPRCAIIRRHHIVVRCEIHVYR